MQMRSLFPLIVFSGLTLWTGSLPAQPPAQEPAAPSSPGIIKFYTDDFWLNLHHFLYVLGRAEAKTAPGFLLFLGRN